MLTNDNFTNISPIPLFKSSGSVFILFLHFFNILSILCLLGSYSIASCNIPIIILPEFVLIAFLVSEFFTFK